MNISTDLPWIGFVHGTVRLLQPRLDRSERFDTRMLRRRFVARDLTDDGTASNVASVQNIRPSSFAWRARRPTLGFDAEFPLVTSVDPIYVREASLSELEGKGRTVAPNSIGALKREVLLLNGIVLVEFSRTRICNASNLGFGSLEEARSNWKFLARHGITVLFDAPNVRELDPFVQALFYNAISAETKKKHFAGIDLKSLSPFNGENPFFWNTIKRPVGANELSAGAISTVAFVSPSSATAGTDARGLAGRSEAWGSDGRVLPFSIAADVSESPEAGLRLVGRSLSHVLAHEILIKQAEALYRHHADSIRSAREWQGKQNACGAFLMNWQKYLEFVKDTWCLGYADQRIDPGIVEAIQNTIVTRHAWADVSSRIDSLVRLSSEVLPDGEAGFLL
mgnify:CR=1 FL=1